MGYSREIREAVDRILRERRREAETDAERRKAAFHLKYPRAEKIERALASTALNAARAVMRGGNTAEQLRKLRETNRAFQAEYDKILAESGEGSLEPRYACPKCRDTGYIDGRMCSCRRDLLRAESYRRLNELTPLSLSTFESFSLNYYSDAPQEGRPADRSIMANTLRYCASYARHFGPDSPSLILTGGTGLGKTHLSLAIANEAIQKGNGVVYSSAGDLVSKLEKEHFGHESGGFAMEALHGCDLLILDDLGTEFHSSFSCAAIYDLVNARLLLRKPTIISTNLSTRELISFYSERFASRIIGSYRRIVFVGNDVRQRRRLEKG